MHLSIGYQETKNEILIRTFGPEEEATNKVYHLDSVEDDQSNNINSLDLLLTDLSDDDLALTAYREKISPHLHHLSQEMIENINYDDAVNLLTKVSEETTIRHNLETITQNTQEGSKLSEVFKNNRDVYAFQIWKFLSKNLSCYNLKVIYQSIDSSDKEAKKLISKVVHSKDFEQINNASEEETMLFSDLAPLFGKSLHVESYDKDNHELTMTSTIGTTNIIIMAKVWNFSILQKSIIEGMMNSIQHFI